MKKTWMAFENARQNQPHTVCPSFRKSGLVSIYFDNAKLHIFGLSAWCNAMYSYT